MTADHTFSLHPRLAADCRIIAEWPLCRVLLLDDARYAWLVLVPRRAGAVEIHRLVPADQAQLIVEIARAGTALEAITRCDKINVGALGNLVPQLHVHVIARREDDSAWPGPVWGAGQAVPYEADARTAMTARLQAAFRA
jgi:diadenosine tetraphosphate (Ap4A) HIT family hydrolase